MDSFEGSAALEWWANRSTCLGEFAVHVTVDAVGDAWTCGASFSRPLTGEEREAFAFLLALDPMFTLRFDEGSAVLVDVAESAGGDLALTSYEFTENHGSRQVWV